MDAIRMIHPTVDGEATAATLDQFRTLWQPRGWELVPDGTPVPGEVGYRPHKAEPPVSDQPDTADTDESTDAAVKPPAKSRRKPAADEPPTPDAATNPED